MNTAAGLDFVTLNKDIVTKAALQAIKETGVSMVRGKLITFKTYEGEQPCINVCKW